MIDEVVAFERRLREVVHRGFDTQHAEEIVTHFSQSYYGSKPLS